MHNPDFDTNTLCIFKYLSNKLTYMCYYLVIVCIQRTAVYSEYMYGFRPDSPNFDTAVLFSTLVSLFEYYACTVYCERVYYSNKLSTLQYMLVE